MAETEFENKVANTDKVVTKQSSVVAGYFKANMSMTSSRTKRQVSERRSPKPWSQEQHLATAFLSTSRMWNLRRCVYDDTNTTYFAATMTDLLRDQAGTWTEWWKAKENKYVYPKSSKSATIHHQQDLHE